MIVPKLKAPFREIGAVEPLVTAGADELFCGVIDREWVEKYGAICSNNRREWAWANFRSFDELAKAIDRAHCLSATVSVTLNASYYTQSMYPDVLRHVKGAVEAGADDLTVVDIPLLLYLRDQGIDVDITMSTGGGTFNHETANFYKELGVKRVVLDRQLTPREVDDLSALTDVELEVLVLFRRCLNTDAFCTFHHGTDAVGLGDVACRFPYTYTLMGLPGARLDSTRENLKKYSKRYAADPEGWGLFSCDFFECGLCALYDFARSGVTTVKIVGRAMPLFDIVPLGVKSARRFLDLLDTEPGMSKLEFYRTVRHYVEEELPEQFCRPCLPNNCYYPTVLEEGNR